MFRGHRMMWAEINLDNFAHNIKAIQKRLKPGTEYIAVIKADAYGHGAIEAAKVCLECGMKWLAVAMLEEALELRNAGISCNIFILGFTQPDKADAIISNNISQACFSYELALKMSEAAVRMGETARIHIALDTGMGRIGFQPTEENADVVERINHLPGLKIEGIFTHFAAADEKDKHYTYRQFDKYMDFIKLLEARGVDPGIKHVGNSAQIIDLPDLNLDGVRPGIIQYGLYPSDEVIKTNIDLKPVMSIKANIVHIKEVEPGTSISYGRKYITTEKARIATLPVGYADGYSRLFFQKARVIINGKYAKVVGRICMDQCMIDVTAAGDDVQVGDEVILMGSDGSLNISADDLASAMGTINYEIVCMISRRVPRVYIKNGEIIKVKNYLEGNA